VPDPAASPRVFCIGRNYAEHARELGNEPPAAPVVFMKPWTSLVPPGADIRFPAHGRELHHEVELVLRIGAGGRDIAPGDALRHVDGVAVGVDLTLRDLQGDLKRKGLPWEAAKAFDQSAPLGDFHPAGKLAGDGHRFWCEVNGQRRQDGDSREMVFDCAALVAALSRVWTLLPGDLVFTGTPPGVGPVLPGQELVVGGDGLGRYTWRIVA
jgi:fumarylpyruvate hydrolase